jgi:hypothetical protein
LVRTSTSASVSIVPVVGLVFPIPSSTGGDRQIRGSRHAGQREQQVDVAADDAERRVVTDARRHRVQNQLREIVVHRPPHCIRLEDVRCRGEMLMVGGTLLT